MRDQRGPVLLIAAVAVAIVLMAALSERDVDDVEPVSRSAVPADEAVPDDAPVEDDLPDEYFRDDDSFDLVSDWADASVTCDFQQLGIPVALSDGPGSVALAAGGWRNGSCPVEQAEVSVRLQAKHEGEWRDIGAAQQDTVRTGREVEIAFTCHNSKPTKWRSVVDVDLVDESDDPRKLRTPARVLSCCPDPEELERAPLSS